MIYMHYFETTSEFEEQYNGGGYHEPWVSYTHDNEAVKYNKSEYEKLLETPLTFEVLSPGELFFGHYPSGTFSRTIEYSKNGGEWISITSSLVTFSEEEDAIVSGGTKIPVLAGDIVQFRGNNTYYLTNEAGSMFGSFESMCKIKGNIMSLINSTDFNNLTTLESGGTFANLFGLFVNLTDASELLLPATTLADYCYSGMFQGCTSLTTAPALPATNLTESCYSGMFQGCTSLAQAPALTATTLADYCYENMFQDCTSLTQTPALPATTLADGCYSEMFQGCTSLAQAPELPATTVAENSYAGMFSNCRSLTTAPALPATTLARRCYAGMFGGTSLTTAPSLPATTLADGCYSSMFGGTSLTTAPTLPATTLANSCYSAMFINCTGLTTAPALPVTTLAELCYAHMFQGCTSLTSAPELPATTLAYSCYQYMFNSCSNLNYIKCLATNISATNALARWVNGVSSTGTFYKAAGVTYPSGESGIPAGWTVIDA